MKENSGINMAVSKKDLNLDHIKKVKYMFKHMFNYEFQNNNNKKEHL